MAWSSGSDSRRKGRSYLAANFWWEATESLLTPMTATFFALNPS